MSSALFPESIKLEILHPLDQTRTGFTIELVGPDHDNVRLEFAKRTKGNLSKDVEDLSAILAASNYVYAAAIIGWENTSEQFTAVFKKLGFEDDSFSKDKAYALINMPNAGWIRAQIDKVIGDREAFFKSASVS